jgi:type VI protein secretion system component VasA
VFRTSQGVVIYPLGIAFACVTDMHTDTFALALERYVTKHVSQHAFTRTVLRSKQRGPVFTWPARDGTRGVF